MFKNHSFTIISVISNSGRDDQWMLQSLGKKVPRNRIVTLSQSVPPLNPFTFPKHLLQGKDILVQQKDVMITASIE